RTTGHVAIVRAIERADPATRNVFVTADELLAGRLTTSEQMRERVLADAGAVARRVRPRAVAPIAPAARAAAAAGVVLAVVWPVPVGRGSVAQGASVVRSQSTGGGAAAPAAQLRVRATIEPPPYTGLKASVADDPEQLQAIEGSTLALDVASPGNRLTVEHDGVAADLTRGGDRAFAYRAALTRTASIVAWAAGVRRTIPIVVTPDRLPTVTITAPGRDLVYAGGNARISFTARATDDFGLRSLRLQYTKVTGSGENFEFEDGEIPLGIARDTPRDWNGRATRTIVDLNLHDGDMLVYRAVAADARDGG